MLDPARLWVVLKGIGCGGVRWLIGGVRKGWGEVVVSDFRSLPSLSYLLMLPLFDADHGAVGIEYHKAGAACALVDSANILHESLFKVCWRRCGRG